MNSSEYGCQCSEMLSPGASVATPMNPDWAPTVFGPSSARTSPPRYVTDGMSAAVTTCGSPTPSTGGSFCQFTANGRSLDGSPNLRGALGGVKLGRTGCESW